MATITINGQLILDQTAGLQADDVEVTSTGGVLGGALDSDFLTFLNGLGLSSSQENFAAFVEGASEPDLVSVSTGPGETVKSLFFSDASGNDFTGQLVPGVTLLDGSPLYMWSADNGHVVLISSSSTAPTAGTIAAAFYIESTNATNTEAEVQSITFMPLLHPDAGDPNDPVDFSDILNVSAAVVTSTPVGDDIIVLDDGPTIVTNDTGTSITDDESFLNVDNSADFANQFTHNFGTDGGTSITYVLEATAGPSGLTDTATGEAVDLSLIGGVVYGKTHTTGLTVFTATISGSTVTLDQVRAVVHTDTTNPDDSTSLSADDLVRIVATITDADGDQDHATLNIGQNLIFKDDGPHISPQGTDPTITVDETHLNTAGTGNYAPNFLKNYGADAGTAISYSLGVGVGATGVTDEESNTAVTLSKNAVTGVIEGKDAGGDLVFTISVDAAGVVSFDQLRSVVHANALDPNDTRLLNLASLVTLTATITDGDGDQASTTLNIGRDFAILDDGPTLTVAVDYPGTDTFLKVGNQAGQFNTGSFGYNIGADDHTAAFYAAGGSDFADIDPVTPGIQYMSLTGTVNGPPVTAITNTSVTLVSETLHQATFNWSFHYDKDPITAGVQDGTATGTLVFDKDADTFTITDTTPVQGFSFDVLHTSELVAKEPTSNVGHPNIVVETLQAESAPNANDGFFVQFTGNNSPFSFTTNGQGSSADTSFNNSAGETHDMFASANETWVSATQDTNGVAGDTIQKGEALTLRFFDHSPGIVTESTADSAVASAVVVKFDGIGNSEDLMVNLDLIDFGADGVRGGTGLNADTSITRTLYISNANIYHHADGVPAPYNTEFSLDNNDGLVIIESNDYNASGDHYQIQGMQILQSANGMTGSAIAENKAIGSTGGSNVLTNLVAFDPTDNDVLKITDIGFVQTTSGTQTASLDFAFNIADGDGDLLGVQHISAQLSTAFIV